MNMIDRAELTRLVKENMRRWNAVIEQDAYSLYGWFLRQSNRDDLKHAILEAAELDKTRRLPWDDGYCTACSGADALPSPFHCDTFQVVMIQSAIKKRTFDLQSVHADSVFNRFVELMIEDRYDR